MIPTRSSYSGQSYKLFTDYNDIHVFVEDAGFENLYTTIFNRLGVNIRKVFSKNGKDSVIEAARACTDQKCVYIVDRDWDDVLNITFPLNNLVVLSKHSIENYLLGYSGFRAVVTAEKPRDDIDQILSAEQFVSIVNEISSRLCPLFECYLAMQMANDTRTNCSQPPGSFKEDNRSCAPDINKISSFINEVSIPIPEGVQEYFAGNVLKDRGHGKYMLHFIWAGIRYKCRVQQMNSDTLMIRLAQTIDTQNFTDLYNQISNRIPSS